MPCPRAWTILALAAGVAALAVVLAVVVIVDAALA